MKRIMQKTKAKDWILDGILVLVTFFIFSQTGCVTEEDVHQANLRLKKTQEVIARVEKGLDVEDPRSVWMCGKRPENMTFNLPSGECVEMVGIPCGSFVMGTPLPEAELVYGNVVGHKVTLTEHFWMAKFPITVAQALILLPHPEGIEIFSKAFDDLNVEKWDKDWAFDLFTFDDACKVVNEMNRLFGDSLPDGYHFGLPTEAQWEFACRAGTVETYNNGKSATIVKKSVTLNSGETKVVDAFADRCPNLDEVGWYFGNTGSVRQRVGMKKPNNWGLYDMHGLSIEWCQDFYSDALERTSINMINPTGPSSGDAHVQRGGGCLLAGFQTSYHRTYGGIYSSPNLPKLNGKPQVASMRLAIVKDVPEAVDSDTRLFGKNYVTEGDWKQAQLEALKRENDAAAEELRQKTKFLPVLKFALDAYEVVQPALEIYLNEKMSRGANGNTQTIGPTGFGTIKGPSSLARGQTATYTLYVGGQKISNGVSWSQAGTSISVYGAGDHARAMAGNPPIKSGHFRSGIKATYNGKTYQKTIQIYK